jgi:hypothetical protein
LEFGCSDVGAVHLLLRAEKAEPRRAPEPIEIGPLRNYDRPPPTLGNYDQLLSRGLCVEVVQ